MSLTFRSKPIDLCKFSVKNRDQERLAIFEIQAQILRFLEDNKLKEQFLLHRSNSILLNKLIYYSAKDIQENYNKNLIISRGWYKYGPCFEKGRYSEESLALMTLSAQAPSKQVIEPIANNCNSEIKLFLASDFNGVPYEFLKHIYKDRSEFDEIKQFYIIKHELSNILSNCFTSKDISKLDEFTLKFDKEIIGKYYNEVNMPEKDIDIIIDFTALMNYLIHSFFDDKSKNIFASDIKSINNTFINVALMLFSHKNYIHTFQTYKNQIKSAVKKHEDKLYDKRREELKSLTKTYYKKVN